MPIRDKFANILTMAVTLSAADTLTFAEISTGLGMQPGRKVAMAMIIDQINYYVGDHALMTTNADNMVMGITTSNLVPDLTNASDRRILDSIEHMRVDFGTAAGGQLFTKPIPHQFFPPLIHAERTIFLGMNSNGLASVVTGRVRIYYRLVELEAAELIELTEVFRLVG